MEYEQRRIVKAECSYATGGEAAVCLNTDDEWHILYRGNALAALAKKIEVE